MKDQQVKMTFDPNWPYSLGQGIVQMTCVAGGDRYLTKNMSPRYTFSVGASDGCTLIKKACDLFSPSIRSDKMIEYAILYSLRAVMYVSVISYLKRSYIHGEQHSVDGVY